MALEITARPCSAASGRSKSLLGRASKPPCNRNRCPSSLLGIRQHYNTAPALLFHTSRLKSLLGRARQPLGVQNHCSRVLRSHLAVEIADRASYFVFDSTRKHSPHSVDGRSKHGSGALRSHSALEIVARASFMASESTFAFPSQSLSKSLRFELCIASSCALCDFTFTAKCHVRVYIYIYIYIYILPTFMF